MRIAVAGAGIAGLTTALALARQGLSVRVFERAPMLEEIGAGIQLSPNAVHVLERLGVLSELAGALVEPEGIEIRDAPSGALLATVPLGRAARSRYGAPYFLIHRADLQSGLAAAAGRNPAIEVRFDVGVDGVRAFGDRVAFRAGGSENEADILIAADGIGSVIRTGHFGHPGPRPLGRTAWRAAVPSEEVPDTIRRDATGLWLGPGGHLVHYPLRAGGLLNVVVIAAGPSGPGPPLAPFGPVARRLIDAVGAWTPWPLFDVDPTLAWARGRVALVGDAAHAMAPSAAQGGATAIEDAAVLATALAEREADPGAALIAFEQARRRRVVRIAREARRNLGVYEMRGLPALARNLVLRALSQERLLARLDWLYGWTTPWDHQSS